MNLVHVAVRRRAARTYRLNAADADDMAQMAALKVLNNVEHYMAQYPNVDKLAAVLAPSAASDLAREHRVQNSLGARLVDDGVGGRRAAREVLPLEIDGGSAAGGGTGRMLHPAVRGQIMRSAQPIDTEVVEQVDAIAELRSLACQLRLSDRDWALLYYVHGLDYSVTDAAKRCGIRRETAARQLSKIRRAATQLRHRA